jgi:hypothetical protein
VADLALTEDGVLDSEVRAKGTGQCLRVYREGSCNDPQPAATFRERLVAKARLDNIDLRLLAGDCFEILVHRRAMQ